MSKAFILIFLQFLIYRACQGFSADAFIPSGFSVDCYGQLQIMSNFTEAFCMNYDALALMRVDPFSRRLVFERNIADNGSKFWVTEDTLSLVVKTFTKTLKVYSRTTRDEEFIVVQIIQNVQEEELTKNQKYLGILNAVALANWTYYEKRAQGTYELLPVSGIYCFSQQCSVFLPEDLDIINTAQDPTIRIYQKYDQGYYRFKNSIDFNGIAHKKIDVNFFYYPIIKIAFFDDHNQTHNVISYDVQSQQVTTIFQQHIDILPNDKDPCLSDETCPDSYTTLKIKFSEDAQWVARIGVYTYEQFGPFGQLYLGNADQNYVNSVDSDHWEEFNWTASSVSFQNLDNGQLLMILQGQDHIPQFYNATDTDPLGPQIDPPCDTTDPNSPCYQVPCDQYDPNSPCYNSPCDPYDFTSSCYQPLCALYTCEQFPCPDDQARKCYYPCFPDDPYSPCYQVPCDQYDPSSSCYQQPCNPYDPNDPCYDNPCDPNNPESPCYQPPCDPNDIQSSCYSPQPFCDPHNPEGSCYSPPPQPPCDPTDPTSSCYIPLQPSLSCSSDPLSTGIFIGQICECLSGSEWNYQLLKCEQFTCIQKQFTSSNLKMDGMCECINGYEWSEADRNCIQMIGCLADPASTGKVLPNGECQCRLYHYWNISVNLCLPTCHGDLATSVDPADQRKCICRAPAAWSNQLKDCYIDCSLALFSSGQQESVMVCECLTHTNWNSKSLFCDLNCSDVKGSTGVKLTFSECECIEGHTWQVDLIVCRRNCEEDPLWSQVINQDGACGCMAGSLWNYQLQKCVALDCTLVSFSAGTAEDRVSCLCEDKFNWNETTRMCIIHCQSIVDPLGTGINVNEYTCQCQSQSQWNSLQNICFKNCQQVEFSTGHNLDATTCVCQLGYSWTTEGNCVSSCGSEVGQTGSYDVINRHCQCSSDFVWSFFKNACYRDCSIQPNSLLIEVDTPDECICRSSYQWDFSTKNCVLKCNYEFDLGVDATGTRCECEPNARYSYTESLCIVLCSSDSLSSGSFLASQKMCECNLNAEWNPNINKCECSPGFSLGPSSNCIKTSGSSLPISVGIGSLVSGTLALIGTKIYEKKRRERRNDETVEVEKIENMESAKYICEAGRQ